MRFIFVNTIFLVIIDMLISSVLYYFMEYEGFSLVLVFIRFFGLIFIFPVTFWINQLLWKNVVYGYLSTFLMDYVLIILLFKKLSLVNSSFFQTVLTIHTEWAVYISVFLPFLIAFWVNFYILRILDIRE